MWEKYRNKRVCLLTDPTDWQPSTYRLNRERLREEKSHLNRLLDDGSGNGPTDGVKVWLFDHEYYFHCLFLRYTVIATSNSSSSSSSSSSIARGILIFCPRWRWMLCFLLRPCTHWMAPKAALTRWWWRGGREERTPVSGRGLPARYVIILATSIAYDTSKLMEMKIFFCV
jgi:hypothetical protein